MKDGRNWKDISQISTGNSAAYLRSIMPSLNFALSCPRKKNSKHDHFLTTNEVQARQEGGEILDSRYFPSCCRKTSKTASASGILADKKVKDGNKGIFTRKSCLCTANCDDCGKPRVVSVCDIPKDKGEREIIIEQIEIECEKKHTSAAIL